MGIIFSLLRISIYYYSYSQAKQHCSCRPRFPRVNDNRQRMTLSITEDVSRYAIDFTQTSSDEPLREGGARNERICEYFNVLIILPPPPITITIVIAITTSDEVIWHRCERVIWVQEKSYGVGDGTVG